MPAPGDRECPNYADGLAEIRGGSDRSNLSFERVRHQHCDEFEAAAATLTRRTAIERALGLTELPRMPRPRRCRPHEIHCAGASGQNLTLGIRSKGPDNGDSGFVALAMGCGPNSIMW